ncbi:hypothetical protein BGZ46_004386 [Entomortierella lignicola]|nr:hypothetical protein BGZ46_004386 [Entomortierella lignicola]
MDPDLVKTLPKFLKEFCDATTQAVQPDSSLSDQSRNSNNFVLPTQIYGLENLQVSKISLPFGSWGGEMGELWQKTYISFLEGLEPMMVDAALSGLVMDQYHRQCQLEMQQLVEVSATNPSGGGRNQPGEHITIFDQRLCTHKAWYHLIQRLVNDASLSHPTVASSLPSSSSIKEMRSYNNFYIAYAQKADIIDLKQQLLLRQLEQEILSPNPNLATNSMFTMPASDTFGSVHVHQPSYNQKSILQPRSEVYENLDQHKRLNSTLRGKVSSPTPHKRYISNAALHLDESSVQDVENREETEKDNGISFRSRNKNRYGYVAPLTHDALETFNRTNSDQEHGFHTMSASSAAAIAPTPTSVAALSIRSNSRNSYRNDSPCSSSGAFAMQPSVGTPGSVASASGFHSPRIAVNGMESLEPDENDQYSSLGELNADQVDGQDKSIRDSFDADYFNQVPVYRPSAYHQQQYKHHQQQMITLKKKPSLLTKVLVNAATGVAVESAERVEGTKKNDANDAGDDNYDTSSSSPPLKPTMNDNYGQLNGSKYENRQSIHESNDSRDESNILIAIEHTDDEFEGRHYPPKDSQALTEHSEFVGESLVPTNSPRASIGRSHKTHDKEEINENNDGEWKEQIEGGEETIHIINRVSSENDDSSFTSSESQLEMLPVEDEEVFIMMTPRRHIGSTGNFERPSNFVPERSQNHGYDQHNVYPLEYGDVEKEQDHVHEQEHEQESDMITDEVLTFEIPGNTSTTQTGARVSAQDSIPASETHIYHEDPRYSRPDTFEPWHTRTNVEISSITEATNTPSAYVSDPTLYGELPNSK